MKFWKWEVALGRSEDCYGTASGIMRHAQVRETRFYPAHYSSRFCNSVQIVDLQSDRTRAGAFQAVEHSYNVGVGKRTRRLDEDGLFDSNIFREVDAIAQFVLIGMVHRALAKEIGKRGAQFRRVINRTHI